MNGHMTLGAIRPKKQMAFSIEEAPCSRTGFFTASER
jgi:hypothetical protein